MRYLRNGFLIAVVVMLVFLAAQAVAEETEEEFRRIDVSRGLFSTSFKVDGEKLKKGEVERMVLSLGDEKASGKLRSYKLYHYTSLVPSGVGGFLVGYSIGYAAFGGEFPTAAFLSGCGAVGVGFLLDKLADGDLVESVDRYNEVLKEEYGISFLSGSGCCQGLVCLNYSF